ncbi:hypothetical protein Plim_3134 [Planctopirus limnophila DSM 3776]|uniref:Uncharacterized protein n=1 Tax=Planctopirus limnophila (strain ATCC 43296 / DSM 3776 / IFAM 1008 / Mu 290) TaxID=521674 RepID=D5SSZ8_PLAL2|nr:hypothetical protein [Planctopirus limnophila]ADG68949.1 hypothetical protein Plim_3134 [Planctopirus limnophila DSM 3776]
MARRTRVRPFGAGIPAGRTLSLVLLLFIVGLCVLRARQPGFWTWLAIDDSRQLVLTDHDLPQNQFHTTVKAHKASAETGPASQVINNTLPDEWSSFSNEAQPIEDRQALQQVDMPAYWRLMSWTKSESFLDLLQRANPQVLFVNLWEEPQVHRGQPVRLRLNVRRVLSYQAGENNLGITQLYEAWGWTTDSKSFPYVVVFPELPAGLPLGADVNAEVEFAGYFLKVMAYDAYETRRGAPLLIGQLRLLQPTATNSPTWPKPREMILWAVGIFAAIGLAIAFGIRQFRQSHPSLPVITTSNNSETIRPSLVEQTEAPTVSTPPTFENQLTQIPQERSSSTELNNTLTPLPDAEKTPSASNDQAWFNVSDSTAQTSGGIDLFAQPSRPKPPSAER